MPEKGIFPEVLKAVGQATAFSIEQCPFFECMAIADTIVDTKDISENLLDTFALSPNDWRKAQGDDSTFISVT